MLGGLVGALAGAHLTPWDRLTRAAFGLDAAALPSPGEALGPTLIGGALGALGGLILGQITLDRVVIKPRWQVRPSRLGRRYGLLALVAGLGVAAAVPLVLPAIVQGEPARAVGLTPLAMVVALGIAGLPIAAIDRARGRQRWREAEAPWPPPRRDDDALPPEVRAALAAAAGPGPLVMDRVITDGQYAAAVLDDPPRLVAHGGAHLIAMAHEAGVPVIVDARQAAQLAAIPTGAPISPGGGAG